MEKSDVPNDVPVPERVMERHPPPPSPADWGGCGGGSVVLGVNFPHQVPHWEIPETGRTAYSWRVQNDVSSLGSTIVALKSPHRLVPLVKVL